MPDPITIYSISREAIDDEGGTLVRIYGDFAGQFGVPYNVHIGPLGTTADPKAYAGIAGRGTTLYLWNEGEIRCYTPMLTAGITVDVLVRTADGSKETLLADALQVLPRQYYGSVFEIRSILPPYYLVGPRNLENVEPVA